MKGNPVTAKRGDLSLIAQVIHDHGRNRFPNKPGLRVKPGQGVFATDGTNPHELFCALFAQFCEIRGKILPKAAKRLFGTDCKDSHGIFRVFFA